MFTKVALIILLCLATISSMAAQQLPDAPIRRHLRVSLVTLGPGERVWQALGHICIRVVDSTKTGLYRDVVFNYGTFDNYEKNFEKKMIEGELLYCIAAYNYDYFLKAFVEKERSFEEQVFLLNDEQKTALVSNLERNTRPENKYYKYNFFVDNCSTRIYYMIAGTLGKGFVFGQTLPKDHPTTYFDLCWQYYRNRHWERIGVNIFFEDRMNMVVDNEAAMFLPAYLSKGMESATINGRKMCEDKIVMAKDTFPNRPSPNQPFILTCLIAIATIAGVFVKKLQALGKITSGVVLLSTGLIGCLILYAWFGTSHTGCENNFNLLWALPTNIIIPFCSAKIKSRYAIVALCLMGLSLVFYLLRMQVMPLFEMTPLLLALVVVYATMYKANAVKAATK